MLTIPCEYGVEVDLRWHNNKIVLAHDPCLVEEKYEDLESYLKKFAHAYIILNIKETGFEVNVVEILKKYNIKNYFFLDIQFPAAVKLLRQGITKFALRLSEYENLDSVDDLIAFPSFVWVDCFTKYPENSTIKNIRDKGIKVCFVSPELQGHQFALANQLIVTDDDYICCKLETVTSWTSR